MKALLVFAMTQLKRFLRDPMYLLFTFIFPLIFLFIAMSLLCYYCNLITDILLPVSASVPDIPG